MKICRFLLLTALSLLLLAAGLLPTAAQTPYRSDVPYTSYIYNLKNQPVEIPAPFAAERVLYSLQADNTLEDAVEIYRELKELYRTLSGRQILHHRVLEEGLNRVDYEGGLSVVVNYGDTAKTVDGTEIAPYDYALLTTGNT